MKKGLIFLFLIIITLQTSTAENLTLYTGNTSRNIKYVGCTVGGDILHFLQMQLDVFKYLKNDTDPALYSVNPEENRGDFLGVSINFALKLPIHLIPGLDRYDFVQPYISSGIGYGWENLSGQYMGTENADGNSGLFTKMRKFGSLGVGIVGMISQTFGVKIDFRHLNINELTKMNYQKRSFSRLSIGICFGRYKSAPKIIK